MTTNFTPTHRTNRAIGKIKAGSPIRVAQYDDPGFFSEVLGRLGVESDHIQYRYHGEDVLFWDSRVRGYTTSHATLEDYVITDGVYFTVSNTDSGWDLLPASPPKPEGVSFSAWGDDLYTLRGDLGAEIKVTAEQLHNLVRAIKERVPEPSPIENARFIHARSKYFEEARSLAKVDDVWYDHYGNEYTDQQVLADYDEIEVIR